MNDQTRDEKPFGKKKAKRVGGRRTEVAEAPAAAGGNDNRAGKTNQSPAVDRDAERAAREKAAEARATRNFFRDCVTGFVLDSSSHVAPAPTEWLWPGRIPLGHLTLLAGDSDAGKSLLTLEMAARVSTGAPWPDQGRAENGGPAATPREPANVLIFTAHDHSAATLRPGLERAGADLERAYFVTGFPLSGGPMSTIPKRQVRLPGDTESLYKALFELAPVRLIVVDPAWAFFNRGGKRSRLAGPAQLATLAETAAFFNVAVVCVTDLRRIRRGGGGYEAGGDRALTAAARAGWGIVRHPRELDKRVLLPLKMNLGRAAPALEFHIDERGVTWEDRPAKITAEAAFAAETSGTEREVAEHWLRLMLANGQRPAREILAQATECGVSIKTLRRAKAELGVTVQRIEFERGKAHWSWSLGEEPRAAVPVENELTCIDAAG